MKTTLTLLLSAWITLTATYPLFSQTPSQIHYQGLLADEQGKPVNRACPESRILFFGNYLKSKKSWV